MSARPLPVITSTVVLDLTRVAWDRQRYAVSEALTGIRAGDSVRIIVADEFPGYDVPDLVADLIDPHGTTVTIEATTAAQAHQWTRYLRDAAARKAATP